MGCACSELALRAVVNIGLSEGLGKFGLWCFLVLVWNQDRRVQRSILIITSLFSEILLPYVVLKKSLPGTSIRNTTYKAK